MIEVKELNISEAIENKIDKSKWLKFKFSDLVENIVEKVVPKDSGLNHYIGLEHLDSGSLKIRRFGETASLIGDKLKIYKGDLIFAKRNAYLKRVAIAEFDAVVSAHSLVLRPKPKNIIPEFLPFFLLSEIFWERAIEISVGSLSPTINWKILAKQEFFLPPKDQQAQWAKMLWAMDEVIEREKQLFATVQVAQEVKLRDIFISRNKDSVKMTKLGSINSQWRCIKLGKLIQEGAIISHLDGNHGSYYPKNDEFVEEGVPYISANCIKDDNISFEKAKYLTNSRADTITKGIAMNGDILLAHNATVGPVCRLKTSLERVILSTSLTYYRVNNKKINPTFLFYFMKSRLFQFQLERVMNQSTRNQVPITTQRNLYFIIPPLDIQDKLIEVLKLITSSGKVVESKISDSVALQKSLINRIFY